ncbi:MAG: class I SAM-dependent methyltransferase [Chloroflexi bacterium]|nr:class I SAM-dependent methyltransferase [Chloroflexota bacterium]
MDRTTTTDTAGNAPSTEAEGALGTRTGTPTRRPGTDGACIVPLPGGYHWQNPALAPREVPDRHQEQAQRAPELKVLYRMLPLPPDRPCRILDLGAGYGTVAGAILDRFPLAEAVCVDFAEARIAVGHGYLAPFTGHFRYVARDLNHLQWDQDLVGPFDAIVSAYAIHHVDDARKQALYREIYAHLVPGGGFFHFECIQAPSAPLRALYWAKEGTTAWERRAQLAAASPEPIPAQPPEQQVPALETHLAWLRETGFVSVDCYWRALPLALFGGYRPLGDAS